MLVKELTKQHDARARASELPAEIQRDLRVAEDSAS